ncbi:UEV domain-containing protein [Russula aff. rugulosa BPL654]|nr:UEV domain-containing protein [Russula aff. rugulosa BPL654]
MSSFETLTQKWLRQNISAYNDGNRVFADIDATLSLYPTLRPKTDVYTYDDGRTQLLLCVHGLLPIDYRQASYHIPIAIWITRQYPREPPLTFVVPTSDMLVKPSQHMYVSGLCRIEYVLNWEKKYESGPTSSRPSQQDAPPRPPPPVPRPSLNSPPPIASPLVSPSRPTPPPKPQTAIPSAIPHPLPPSVHTPSPVHTQYHRTPNPPPKPPLPPPLFSSPSQPLHSPDPTQSHNRASSFGTTFQSQPAPSVWHGTPSIQPPEPIPSSPRKTLLPGQANSSLYGAAFPPSHVAGTNLIHRQQPPEHRPAASDPQQQSTTTLHVNLLDEDEDTTADDIRPLPVHAAPPRPPNPELLQLHARAHEKLRTELASVSQAMTLDGERLRAQQADLLKGVPAIRDEMGRLEAVRDVCRGVADRLREVVQTAERGVTELRRKGDPPVDELVCSTSIVHNQLIDLVAEDNAIEDTIYHLHRALNAGRIDLDRFLRTTRVLAEEQFMKRALIERIQTSLPMGASVHPVHPGWT